MWFAYLDESKQDNGFFVYSALIVDSDKWNEAFDAVKEFRRLLRLRHGIYINHELHAWKFAAGKGQISDRVLKKPARAKIFAEVLSFIANCGHFRLVSGVNINEQYAFERVMNRINRTAQEEAKQVLLFCDEGQEIVFTRRIRRMRVFNYIPSNRGIWETTGGATKNIPLRNVIEDPVFKKSHMSYFIQLVDFCAYALLRMERPIPTRTIHGYDRMYGLLAPCVIQAVNRRCPRGLAIIR